VGRRYAEARGGLRVSGKRLWRINALTSDQPERIAA
jgi:hypothetical protein